MKFLFDDSRWVSQPSTVGSVLELFLFLSVFVGVIILEQGYYFNCLNG